MPHYHSDRQAVLCPRPPPPLPPDCRGNPRTPAQCPEPASVSHSSYWKQVYFVRCEFYILCIRTCWCKILLDCLHDALHGAGLDDDDEVNHLEGEEPGFQHLLPDLLDFYLLQCDAVLKRTPGYVSMSWSIDHDNHLFSKRHTRLPLLPPTALAPLSSTNS